jgi:hypothetical protein
MAEAVEAFLDTEGLGALGPVSYRAGYRYADTEHVICSIELPAVIAESTVFRNSKLAVSVTSDGHIESTLSGSVDGLPVFVAEPIDALIVHLLKVENFRLEEISATNLNNLLQRLERSTALVRKAIEELAANTRYSTRLP